MGEVARRRSNRELSGQFGVEPILALVDPKATERLACLQILGGELRDDGLRTVARSLVCKIDPRDRAVEPGADGLVPDFRTANMA